MAEYISRGAVNDLIEDMRNNRFILMCERFNLALLKSKVAEIPAADVQPVNRWINVKDRLPDATYDCLVWYSCDTAFGKCKSWGIAHCSRCDWYTKHLDGDNIEVLYWMPMPEPPQD